MKETVRFFSTAKSKILVGLLRRICGYLPASSRLPLAHRLIDHHPDHHGSYISIMLHLLREKGIDKITFRRDQTLWTSFTWDIAINWSLFKSGHHQGDNIQALLQWLEKHGRLEDRKNVIIDVGANIGTSTIPFVQETHCQVLAIEPMPDNFDLLVENVTQNGLQDRVVCVQKAVLAQPGEVEMVQPEFNSGSAFVNGTPRDLEGPPDIDTRKVVKVQADRLMNILESCYFKPEQIAVVWCDAEGCEAEVVETGQPLWSAGVPLYLELNPEMLERKIELSDFFRLLSRYFDRFIQDDELRQRQSAAGSYPIAQLPELAEQLEREESIADVLLMPRSQMQS